MEKEVALENAPDNERKVLIDNIIGVLKGDLPAVTPVSGIEGKQDLWVIGKFETLFHFKTKRIEPETDEEVVGMLGDLPITASRAMLQQMREGLYLPEAAEGNDIISSQDSEEEKPLFDPELDLSIQLVIPIDVSEWSGDNIYIFDNKDQRHSLLELSVEELEEIRHIVNASVCSPEMKGYPFFIPGRNFHGHEDPDILASLQRMNESLKMNAPKSPLCSEIEVLVEAMDAIVAGRGREWQEEYCKSNRFQ